MKTDLPGYVQQVVKKLEASEPGLRLVEWRPYRREPFRYALLFETQIARTEEELSELEARMFAMLNDELGERRMLVYTEVLPAPIGVGA